MREQLWIVPSGDPARPMRATVFRPREIEAKDAIEGRSPLAVINHGTDDNTRLAVSMPVYYWLSRWFVERGYVVIVPQRRGHGSTGGELSESVGSCSDPDHFASGVVAADDIAAAVGYMVDQPFIDPRRVTVAGVSTGGWAALAYAARNSPNVEAVVNFAGGRGGHAFGRDNEICNAAKLNEAVRRFGESARIPTIWFYSKNDSFFGPEIAASLAAEWKSSGGRVESHLLPAYGADGHAIADDRAGWDLWGDELQAFLGRTEAERMSGFHVADNPGLASDAAPATASDAISGDAPPQP